jgi:23S rRNA pseudouridine1911/1915/1917 synthase
MRLDKVCVELFNLCSRNAATEAIKRGEIVVNGKRSKASKVVQCNDTISYTPSYGEISSFTPFAYPLDIIYEDEDLIALNKPAGMAMHPSKGHHEETLLNAVLYHCADLKPINGIRQPGILHRLDKDTSGLVIMAKNQRAHINLKMQFENHTLEKRYLALCRAGGFSKEWQLIDKPIAPAHGNRMEVRYDNSAKEAQTKIKLKENRGEWDLIECLLLTGRTHQIRVHCCDAGYPLIGDQLYGGESVFHRQALHCYSLRCTHPSGETLTLCAPLTKDLEEFLNPHPL